MAFDVDAFRAAHRPWSFTVGGRTFGAKHVSAPVVMEYERRAQEGLVVGAKQHRRGARLQLMALRWLLRHAFPWRPTYLLRGDPVDIILGLEPAARAEALRDFFVCLQGKTPAKPLQPTQSPTIPGTRSPAPTPRRSA